MKKRTIGWQPSLVVTLTFLGIILGSFACGTNPDPLGPNGTQISKVEENAKTLRTVYAENLQYLRDNHIRFDDPDAVLNSTLDFYARKFGEDSPAYRSIAAAVLDFERSSGMQPTQLNSSSNLYTTVQRVDNARNQAPNLEQFLGQLQGLQETVLNSSWTDADKTTSLSYLILLEESMRFLGQTQSQGLSSAQYTTAAFSFWRCAAGVIGGAIAGGLGGAAAGSAIPAVGTTAGGVIGAIGGGLSGAAASC